MAAPCSQEYVSCGVILEVGVLGTRYLRGPASLKQRFVFMQVGSSRMWRYCRGIGPWRGRRHNVSEILLIHPGDTDTLWCWSWRFWFPAAGMLPLMGSREQGMRVRVDRGRHRAGRGICVCCGWRVPAQKRPVAHPRLQNNFSGCQDDSAVCECDFVDTPVTLWRPQALCGFGQVLVDGKSTRVEKHTAFFFLGQAPRSQRWACS